MAASYTDMLCMTPLNVTVHIAGSEDNSIYDNVIYTAWLTSLVRAYMQTWYPDGESFSAEDEALLAMLPAPYTAPNGLAFVAVLGEEESREMPVGCLLALTQPDPNNTDHTVVDVRKMYVTPEARRHGVARILLAAAERFARETGATALTLCVSADRTPAHALYLTEGYEDVSQSEDGFWHMRRTLTKR